jgi:hypothetical protein
MPEYDLINQAILVALWVGLLYGLYGLVLAYLALTDLEWRWLIADRLRANWRALKNQLGIG